MAIPERFIEELKDRVSVSEVLGKSIRLIPNGREFKANCPFHNEKTPSFTVNDEKGFYYCFGCGAKGNAISFLMEHGKQSFPEAVESLAALAGMSVPESSPEERARAERREELGDIVTEAAKFYAQQLHQASAAHAQRYVRERGLTVQSVQRFAMGYAPPSARGSISPLVAHLTGKGFTQAQMVEAGLAKLPDDGRPAYDFFRDRLMFTITDGKGRPIGFGGRILGDGEPKYLNSPDGPLFDKGRTLYGLAQAKESARSKGRLLITEGYMDVIALSEAGFTEAVAPLGTAITENHFLSAWRTAPDVVLCFDGDKAGQRAALRAAERCLPVIRTGKRVRFATLPQGEDPDTLVRNHGTEAFAQLADAALPLAEQLWRSTSAAAGTLTPDALAADRKKLRELTDRIPDPDLAQSYSKLFNDRLFKIGRPPKRSVGRPGGPKGSAAAARAALGGRLQSSAAPQAWMRRHQSEVLFAALLYHPELCSQYDEQLGEMDLPYPDLCALRDCLLDAVAQTDALDSDSVECHFASVSSVQATVKTLKDRSKRFSEEGARKTHSIAQAERLITHLFDVMAAERP